MAHSSSGVSAWRKSARDSGDALWSILATKTQHGSRKQLAVGTNSRLLTTPRLSLRPFVGRALRTRSTALRGIAGGKLGKNTPFLLWEGTFEAIELHHRCASVGIHLSEMPQCRGRHDLAVSRR